MTQSNHQSLRAIGFAVIGLLFQLLSPAAPFAQMQTAAPPVLRTGVIVIPPLCMKTADNQWEGFSVELWKAVANEMRVAFEFQEFANPQLMLDALERREIDAIPSLIVRERYEPVVDYSQSYVKSGLAIAVPAERGEYRWAHILESFFSKEVIKAIGFMLFVSLLAGMLVWAFERSRNREMFGQGTVEGIGHGIWWAMVTMTTVGYGDKAPRTIGGRIVALVWMIFSIVFIAGFTANITTSLTLNELKGRVRGFKDLYHVQVGSLSGSEGADFLVKQGINFIPFETFQEGLRAVAGKQIDAFVQDEHILKYQAKKDFPGRVQVLPGTYDEYFISIALQNESPIRKPINKALLRFMKTEKWTELSNRYFG
jgi:ABC-type amino acid transport substrate-binding protein